MQPFAEDLIKLVDEHHHVGYVQLRQLEVGHSILVSISENVGCKHQRHIIGVHFVLCCIVDEPAHEIDDDHEGISVQFLHLPNRMFQQLGLLILRALSYVGKFLNQAELTKWILHVSEDLFNEVSHDMWLIFKCHFIC